MAFGYDEYVRWVRELESHPQMPDVAGWVYPVHRRIVRSCPPPFFGIHIDTHSAYLAQLRKVRRAATIGLSLV
jgi:hypothetical protein